MFISQSGLWKGCFAVFKVKVTVKVLNNVWMVKVSMVMHHHQPDYHSEISFCDVQGHKATILSTRTSGILKLLQSWLVWWYIMTRQGKTLWKDFLAFTQGVRQRIWLGGLWTRLLPLLAIPIYLKQGSILIPIKKMWKEHCFCNECTCFLDDGSSVLILYPFVLVMMSA